MFTSEQLRAARAMLRIEQRDLAEWSGVSVETIKRIERTPGMVSIYTSTMMAIQRALEEAGVEFIPENGGGPGVRLRKPVAAPAKRASALKPVPAAKTGPPKKARSRRP